MNGTQRNKRGVVALLAGSGCLVVVVTAAIGLAILGGIGVGVAAVFAPNLLNRVFSGVFGFETITSQPVPGDPARFDPIASFQALRAFAGEGAILTDFEASFVRSDGTLDLTAEYKPSPRVQAEFLIPASPPADAPPVGAGGLGPWFRRVTIEAYRPGQTGRVTSHGASGTVSYSYENEGMTRDADAPSTHRDAALEPPTCSFAELWRAAIAKGAPAHAVAVIEYDEDGYDFAIRDVGFDLEFDRGCKPITSD